MNTKSTIVGVAMGVALTAGAILLFSHHQSSTQPEQADGAHVKTETTKVISESTDQPKVQTLAPQPASAPSPSPTGAPIADSPKTVECSIIADEAKAERLITRLFKEAKINGYDRVVLSPGASVCLLEVDLSILGNTGFMYVLPNGEELLNGPMLDKRSRVGVPTSEQVEKYENGQAERSHNADYSKPKSAQDAKDAQDVQDVQARASMVTTNGQSATEQALSSPTETKFNSPMEVFQAMKALPALVSGGEGRAVYVLLDPLCTHCQSLFKKSADLSEKFGIQWHWVPMFTNTSGHAMTALVMKVAERNREEGLLLLSEMMSDNFDVQKYADQFRSLKKIDYERPQPNAFTFLKILKSSAKAAGTPYVAFEIPATGQVEVISGEPEESDLLPLLGGADQQD